MNVSLSQFLLQTKSMKVLWNFIGLFLNLSMLKKRTACLVAVCFSWYFFKNVHPTQLHFVTNAKRWEQKHEVCLISFNFLIPWCLHLNNCWVASHNHILFKNVFQLGCFFFNRNTLFSCHWFYPPDSLLLCFIIIEYIFFYIFISFQVY